MDWITREQVEEFKRVQRSYEAIERLMKLPERIERVNKLREEADKMQGWLKKFFLTFGKRYFTEEVAQLSAKAISDYFWELMCYNRWEELYAALSVFEMAVVLGRDWANPDEDGLLEELRGWQERIEKLKGSTIDNRVGVLKP